MSGQGMSGQGLCSGPGPKFTMIETIHGIGVISEDVVPNQWVHVGGKIWVPAKPAQPSFWYDAHIIMQNGTASWLIVSGCK